MAHTLAAQDKKLTKLFSDDYVFNIPGYQRPYAWTTVQAQELLDDLLAAVESTTREVEDMAPYFLGSIVLIKREESPDADVVDGQQRLTTLTILLSAIRACLTKESANITPLLYEKESKILGTKDRFRLTLRERDSEFFQKYVQKEDGIQGLLKLNDELSDSQTNIRENAKCFMERLSGLGEATLDRLAQFVLTRCSIVLISTPDLDSAYRIFSVLNARGLDLSPTDILKSEILGGVPSKQRAAYTKKWEDAEEALGRENFTSLFGHIRMVYRRQKPHGTLLKEFKEHVMFVEPPAQFIDKVLLPMKKAFAEILDGVYENKAHDESVNVHLKWLNRLEFNDWVPPALAFAIRHRQEPTLMAAFFRGLERLAYAFLINKTDAYDRIDRFSRLTASIDKDAELHEAGSPLLLTADERAAVYSRLNGKIYETYNPPTRTTLLLRLDSILSGGGASYDYPNATVEHILPQNPAAGSQWFEWFPDEALRSEWVHKLGNLTLLTRRKNSSASNYEFGEKKLAYFVKNGVTPFALTTQVLDKTTWTPDVIATRQMELLSAFVDHWQIDQDLAASSTGLQRA